MVVAVLPPESDKLIKAVRAAIVYATYEMDTSSQRHILRNYGARYYYTLGENVDDEVMRNYIPHKTDFQGLGRMLSG